MDALTESIGVWGIIICGVLLLAVAFAGSVLPALPGVPFATAAFFLVHFTIHKYAWYSILIVVLLTIIISIADYVVPVWGTKKYGGSKAGIRGSTIGLIVGVLISFFTSGLGVLALILGPFFGAYIGEKYVAKVSNKVALRAAWGSLVGFMAGTAGKILVVLIISIYFFIGVL